MIFRIASGVINNVRPVRGIRIARWGLCPFSVGASDGLGADKLGCLSLVSVCANSL